MRSKIAKNHSHVDENDIIYYSLYNIVTIKLRFQQSKKRLIYAIL